ncbi:MAG: metallophosphoesterase [Lachnospiraceae bacterium]|nr:metallophosphoesterase [Lachnospiraceae bacterium]
MIKIALFSDIHFGKLSRTKEFSLPGHKVAGEPPNACSMTNSLISVLNNQDVSYIIVCGDLTSQASPLEFHYCAKKITEIASAANIPPKNIVWTVGNHDLDWSIAKLSDNPPEDIAAEDVELLKTFYRKIAGYSANLCATGLLPIEETGPVPFSGLYKTDNFVVFILNSAQFSTHDQEVKHGKLGDEQRSWFNDCASRFSDDHRWKIVVVHHHPFNYQYPTPGLEISQIEDGSELVDIAGRTGINIIVHGHRHHPIALTRKESGWRNSITFICAGSLSVNVTERSGEIPNTFHIIELNDSPGNFDLLSYEYSDSDGWHALHDRKETPLDSVMHLGKVFDYKEKQAAAHALWNSIADVKRFPVSSLPEELYYCKISEARKILEDAKPSEDSAVMFDEKNGFFSLFKE